MAPEHPPQLMATLNLYWWSDMMGWKEGSYGEGERRRGKAPW